MPRTPLLLALLLLPTMSTIAEDDQRQLVSLPEPMRQHMLANMRDHLLAIEQIMAMLAGRNYEAAANLAEERLGMTAMQTHGAHHMAAHMPEPMRAIGSAMHHAASRLAVNARDAEIADELAAPLAGLSQVMTQCVACHDAYRLH